jgi:hypothetical protein
LTFEVSAGGDLRLVVTKTSEEPAVSNIFYPEDGGSTFNRNVGTNYTNARYYNPQCHTVFLKKFYTLSRRKLAQVATLLTCIREVPGWNLGRDSDYRE